VTAVAKDLRKLGRHLAGWWRGHRHCPRCGQLLIDNDASRAAWRKGCLNAGKVEK
jgi:hypothetical protein